MSSRIPEQFIQELLSRINIVDVIAARMSLKKAGANYIGNCPFHVEKTPSFSVAPIKQFYHCFGCGANGDAIQFLIEHEGLRFMEAVKSLAHSVGMELPQEQGEVVDPHAELYRILEQASGYYQAQLRKDPAKPAVAYLKQRGVTGAMAKQFGIGFAPPGWDHVLQYLKRSKILETAGLVVSNEQGRTYDRFRNRIMFPIRDRRGRVVGFGGRAVEADQQPKYLNSPETPIFHKGHELYGLYEARQKHRTLDKLVVVEGYLDVIALVQHGITEVVATLGTAFGKQHVQILFQNCSHLILCFDGDEAGRKAAWRALQVLLPAMTPGRKASFLHLPMGMDPDLYVRQKGAKALQAMIDRATSLPDYLFNQLAEHLDLGRLEGRVDLVHQAMPLIQTLPEGPLKQLLYERLAQQVGLDLHSVMNMNARSVQSFNRGEGWQKKKSKPLPLLSPAMRAVAILLWNRAWVDAVDVSEDLTTVDSTGAEFLWHVVKILRQQPEATFEEVTLALPAHLASYMVIEELHAILSGIPSQGLKAELEGAVRRLHEEVKQKQMDILLEKSKTEGLSKQEKEQLQQLFKIEESQS